MSEIKAVVFDLYGTLFDVHSVVASCESRFPGRGREVSLLWRQKQLEYTWLRSLMGQYISFEDATQDALRFACHLLGLPLASEARRELCSAYLELLPFPEVPAALDELKSMGLPLAILSNGSVRTIDAVVTHSGLADRFNHLISVENVQVFKPHPRVYQLGEQALERSRAEVLFVSSNAWDASGAAHFGYPTCWINRAGSPFEELGQRPTHEVAGVDAVPALLDRRAA